LRLKRVEWNEDLERMLESKLGDGTSGYVGFNENFRKATNKIFDEKAILNDDLRRAIKAKFPEIRTKDALRKTVDYNRRRIPREKKE
jgi:hypothetical protein